jgi:hypothetical protein
VLLVGLCFYVKSFVLQQRYLKMLIDYAEDNASAAPDIRVKLRYVTKAVLQNKDSYGVLPMLATHGGGFFCFFVFGG